MPTETANPRSLWTLATMQFSWHWLSCGQTRPQMAGRRLVSLMSRIAPRKSPSATSFRKPGTSTPTGQPETHGSFLQERQRTASARACAGV